MCVYGGRGKHRRGFWHDVVCDWAGMHGVCEIQCKKEDKEHKKDRSSDRTVTSLSGTHGNLFLERVFSGDLQLLKSFYDHGCWCGATNTKCEFI